MKLSKNPAEQFIRTSLKECLVSFEPTTVSMYRFSLRRKASTFVPYSAVLLPDLDFHNATLLVFYKSLCSIATFKQIVERVSNLHLSVTFQLLQSIARSIREVYKSHHGTKSVSVLPLWYFPIKVRPVAIPVGIAHACLFAGSCDGGERFGEKGLDGID